MKHRATVLALGALLAFSACKGDEKKKADAPGETTAKTESRSAAKARQPQTDYDVATEEDFAEAMEQQITAETDLSKELDRLEQEITK